jgi:hypothetical protein
MQVEAFIYGQMAHLLHAVGHVAGNKITVGSIWEARTQPAWWRLQTRNGTVLHETVNAS